MLSMIMLMSRLLGGHSKSAGWRPEKLGYQHNSRQSADRHIPGDWWRQNKVT